MTKIKICGITRIPDALAAAQAKIVSGRDPFMVVNY